MLSSNAFNAFLKTLEEPPSYAIFILATTEKHKIIPTILSRCQIFDFKRISIADIVFQMEKIAKEEGINADKSALHIIAQKADGGMRDALSLFDKMVSFSGKDIKYEQVIENLNILDYDYYFKVTEALLVEDSSSTLLIYNEISEKGFDGEIFMLGLSEHFRNLLVCKDSKTIKLLEIGNELKERYLSQSSKTTDAFLLNALNLANQCDIGYKMSKNKRLQVELSLLKMCFLNSQISATFGGVDAKK
jgi:DNA polymerase-3 subunit gamma/tau